MSKAVIELQREALESVVPVPSLLRKAHAIATKLSLGSFDNWCQKELKGYYENESNKPEYRFISVSVRALNPYRGYIPVVTDDNELMEVLTRPFIQEPIDQIESMANSEKDSLTFSLVPRMQKLLMESSGLNFEVKAFADRAQMVGILQAVRNIVLDWTLQLERDGVLGDDLQFTVEERNIAQDHITNYGTLILGNVSRSRVQRDDLHSEVTSHETGVRGPEINALLEQILTHLRAIPLEQESMSILSQTLVELKTEIANKIPNPTKVNSLFQSVRSILENATGSIIASGIIFEIGRLFPQ